MGPKAALNGMRVKRRLDLFVKPALVQLRTIEAAGMPESTVRVGFPSGIR